MRHTLQRAAATDRAHRIVFTCVFMLAALISSSCATGATPLPAPAAPTLAEELRDLVHDSLLPGAICVIERDGIVVDSARVGWQNVEGRIPLREDSIFRLYSMSKPITSVAIMMLAEQGRLALDDPASKFLPEFRAMRVYVSGGLEDMITEPARRPITIRDLLLHDSGITYHFTGNTPVHQYYRKHGVMRDTPVGRRPGDGQPARSLEELSRRIADAPLLQHPGDGFRYSYATTILGAIIERATGQRLDRALRAMLFEPLGMTDTGFVVSDEQLPRFTTLYSATATGIEPVEHPRYSDYRDRSRLLDGGGALAATAADYLRFARMLANGGRLGGRRYLSAETVREMFTPQIWIDTRDGGKRGFGYGFAIGDAASERSGGQPAGTAGWSGSGNTYFFIDPDSRLIALLMTHALTPAGQASRATALRAIVLRAALRAYARGDAIRPASRQNGALPDSPVH